jgi:hypothetical protein
MTDALNPEMWARVFEHVSQDLMVPGSLFAPYRVCRYFRAVIIDMFRVAGRRQPTPDDAMLFAGVTNNYKLGAYVLGLRPPPTSLIFYSRNFRALHDAEPRRSGYRYSAIVFVQRGGGAFRVPGNYKPVPHFDVFPYDGGVMYAFYLTPVIAAPSCPLSNYFSI